MQTKHVRIVIHPDGACTVDAMHFTDATCMQATQQILQALAGSIIGGRFKPEAQRLPPQAQQGREITR